MKLTVYVFSVTLKMKSLSILVFVSFATSLAMRIKKYEPEDTTFHEGETMKLSCLTNVDVEWYRCEFTHESNGKSCKTFWIQDNIDIPCRNEIGKMYQKDGSCIFEVKDLKKEGTGNWTCKLSDLDDLGINSESATHIFAVEVQDKPSTATRPTEFMTFSILAFTFFIVF